MPLGLRSLTIEKAAINNISQRLIRHESNSSSPYLKNPLETLNKNETNPPANKINHLYGKKKSHTRPSRKREQRKRNIEGRNDLKRHSYSARDLALICIRIAAFAGVAADIFLYLFRRRVERLTVEIDLITFQFYSLRPP